MNAFHKIRKELDLHEPISYRNLAIFPLIKKTTHGRPYITLTDALSGGEFRITEVNESGRIPEVRVENLGVYPVLLLDGEELKGAMQNRILNLTIMIPPKTNLDIPVSCVEGGRWSHSNREFEETGRTAYSSLRARKVAQVSESLDFFHSRAADQHEIWDDLDEKAERMRATSPTRAMARIYEAHGDTLEAFGKHMQPSPEQNGSIFAIDGEVMGVDLFDHPKTFRELFPKLLHGYALDAIDREQGVSAVPQITDAENFLSELSIISDVNSFDAIGLGTDLRFQGPNITGSALDALDHIVHLCAFSSEGFSGHSADDDGSERYAARSSLRRSWRVRGTAHRE